MKKIGLALSGGGIKSFSQLPILKTLDEEGIHIDAVSGTSMGSVIAAFLAIGMPIEDLTNVLLELESEVKDMKVFSRPVLKMISMARGKDSSGFVDGIIFEEMLGKYFEQYNIENINEVKIPLAIPAVDIITGKIIVFVSHPEQFKHLDDDWVVVSDVSIAKAVRASCSFPFVIDACPYENYHLSDGGIRMNLPLPLIEAYGVDESIAVTMHSEKEFHEFDSLMALGTRITDLGRIEQDKLLLKKASVSINVPLDGVWVFDAGKGPYTIEEGNKAVLKKLKEIQNIHKKETWFEKIKRKF
ncbi:patatin-like phospholipase family protein [Erysipelothrix urinaevulpis]|uniref:patatin-like phospholipase family protein n=1 Tax=Erysipelothrix urinaevulpis TaxID=2683717 RepID=UPI001358AECF|nr:patatin-like phospholipase family protein [Erysipelothrix urinaevulpis]